MRRIGACLLLGIGICLLEPGEGVSQLPSGGLGGSKWMFGDPNMIFDMMSGGKDVVTRDTVTNAFMQRAFDRAVEQLGITNGQLTRQQYLAYMQQRMGGAVPGAAPGAS